MSERQQQEVLEKLTQWGCDVAGALERVLGSRELYCRLLQSIPQDKAFDALDTALRERDVRTAFEQAHSLKGVLGNMGLTPMYRECCDMVEPLRSGTLDGVATHYETFRRQRETLTEILNGPADNP